MYTTATLISMAFPWNPCGLGRTITRHHILLADALVCGRDSSGDDRKPIMPLVSLDFDLFQERKLMSDALKKNDNLWLGFSDVWDDCESHVFVGHSHSGSTQWFVVYICMFMGSDSHLHRRRFKSQATSIRDFNLVLANAHSFLCWPCNIEGIVFFSQGRFVFRILWIINHRLISIDYPAINHRSISIDRQGRAVFLWMTRRLPCWSMPPGKRQSQLDTPSSRRRAETIVAQNDSHTMQLSLRQSYLYIYYYIFIYL